MGQIQDAVVPAPLLDAADGRVLVAVKTPLMPSAATWALPGRLTLRESLAELQRSSPRDDTARQVLAQLERETSGSAFQFLVVSEDGTIAPAPPSTRLSDIACGRDVPTSKGLQNVKVAAFEVQAYAPVGG